MAGPPNVARPEVTYPFRGRPQMTSRGEGGGVHDIVTMLTKRGKGERLRGRHIRHICGKAWPGNRG